MTQTEYEQNRAECLIAFYEDQSLTTHSVCQALYYAFDRGYALGKQQKTIAQEDIEKAAEAFATPPIGNGGMFTRQQVKELLVKFAQLFPGKQEKDADTVIQGWVTRDKTGYLVLHYKEPHRTLGGEKWYSAQSQKSLPRESFPDLTWESDPQEVEIIIKRKKK